MSDRDRSAIMLLTLVALVLAALTNDPVPRDAIIGRDGSVWVEVRR